MDKDDNDLILSRMTALSEIYHLPSISGRKDEIPFVPLSSPWIMDDHGQTQRSNGRQTSAHGRLSKAGREEHTGSTFSTLPEV
jgi:hypothetical protein